MNLEVKLRLRISELFPSVAEMAGLFFGAFLGGMAEHDGAGLERSSGSNNAVPEIVGGDHRETDAFASFFGDGESLSEKLLLDTAKELLGFQFVFARSRTAEDTDVEDNDITAAGLDAVENIAEMIESMDVADGNEDVARTGADGFG